MRLGAARTGPVAPRASLRGGEARAISATVLGLSTQDLASHAELVAKHGLNVPLLADVDKQVAKAYRGLDYQSVDDLKAALDALPA